MLCCCFFDPMEHLHFFCSSLYCHHRTSEFLWHGWSPRSCGHQFPQRGEGRIQWSSVQLQNHLSHHRGKPALSCPPVQCVWNWFDWMWWMWILSSDENTARFHLGGVGALCRSSHNPKRLVTQEAAGVHHAWTEPALPSLGLKLT